jgi:hypothetical protein
MTHKSKNASSGPILMQRMDSSSFTSPESDYTSSSIQGASKQHVDQHQIIEVEQSSSSEPIPRQNFCDGDKVDIDLYHVRWA